MRNSRDISRRAALALAALPLALAASRRPAAAQDARPAGAVTLDALLARFAALPGLHASFREEKHLSLLAAPLVSEGTLDYAPPSRMVRRTTSPAPATVLIEGSSLRFDDGRTSQRVDMNAAPIVRQFVDGFLAIVSGDRAALERSYEPAFRVPDPRRPDAWELTLRPRVAAIERVFRSIELRGRGVVLDSMTLRERSGDETRTTFTSVDTARRYAPAEAARVFRVGP